MVGQATFFFDSCWILKQPLTIQSLAVQAHRTLMLVVSTGFYIHVLSANVSKLVITELRLYHLKKQYKESIFNKAGLKETSQLSPVCSDVTLTAQTASFASWPLKDNFVPRTIRPSLGAYSSETTLVSPICWVMAQDFPWDSKKKKKTELAAKGCAISRQPSHDRELDIWDDCKRLRKIITTK